MSAEGSKRGGGGRGVRCPFVLGCGTGELISGASARSVYTPFAVRWKAGSFANACVRTPVAYPI